MIWNNIIFDKMPVPNAGYIREKLISVQTNEKINQTEVSKLNLISRDQFCKKIRFIFFVPPFLLPHVMPAPTQISIDCVSSYIVKKVKE